MRYRDAQLQEGDELREGGHVYTVARVEQAASPTALGKAWVRLTPLSRPEVSWQDPRQDRSHVPVGRDTRDSEETLNPASRLGGEWAGQEWNTAATGHSDAWGTARDSLAPHVSLALHGSGECDRPVDLTVIRERIDIVVSRDESRVAEQLCHLGE